MAIDFDKPYNGKAWAELSEDEKKAAAAEHWVRDPSELSSDLNEIADRWHREAAGDVR